MTLHEAADQLLHCWATNDRERYAATRNELERDHGRALANTAHEVARWQIRRYARGESLPDWCTVDPDQPLRNTENTSADRR